MENYLITLFNFVRTIFYPSFIFILLGLLALVLIIRQRTKLAAIILAFNILLFYFCANGWIASICENKLMQVKSQVTEPIILQNKALILLGGGLTKYHDQLYPSLLSYSRILEANRIYQIAKRNNITYTIFISGGDPWHLGNSEAAIYRNILLELGIPANQIITETKSRNTWENAKFLAEILKNYSFSQYLLVTSGINLSRAQSYLGAFGIKTIPAPADFFASKPGLLPSIYKVAFTEMDLHELSGLLRQHLYAKPAVP